MHCIIISETASFPWGMAASSRVGNIAKALTGQGVKVSYLGLRGANTKYESNKHRRGVSEGIYYNYPGGFPVRSGNWLVRRIDEVLGKWFTVTKITRLKNQGLIDAVIIYSRSYKTVSFWSKKLNSLGIKVILELCEWPLSKTYNANRDKVNAIKFCNHAILCVDAILPISTYIEQEINSIANKYSRNIPTFKVPILADFGHIASSKFSKKSEEKYILYSGSTGYIDIAYFIIDVIEELKIKGYGLKLKFTGSISPGLLAQIKTYVVNKDINDLVYFTGYLEESQLYSNMMNAVCLLAPLPDTVQSKARFPTKIGYYMSSGRPIVTNAVGSVQEYLTDKENAYIAEKFGVSYFVRRIIEIVEDTKTADKIGQAGKKLAYEKFYYLNACKGLREFIENVKPGNS